MATFRSCMLFLLVAVNAACSSSNERNGDAVAHPVERQDADTDHLSTPGGRTRNQCDPLAAPSTVLAGILGVGRDDQGILYVADAPPGTADPRVFIASGGQLVRRHVAGTGQSGGAVGSLMQYVLQFASDDAGRMQSLLLDVQGGAARQMALGPGASKSFLGGGPDQTPLVLVDATQVAGLPIVNLPNVVIYLGRVTDGTILVVTRPMDAYSSAEFHLFYGMPNDVREYEVVSFDQSGSGYPVTLSFRFESSTYSMTISSMFDTTGDGAVGPGPGTLHTDASALPFSIVLPPPATLSEFAFTCFSN